MTPSMDALTTVRFLPVFTTATLGYAMLLLVRTPFMKMRIALWIPTGNIATQLSLQFLLVRGIVMLSVFLSRVHTAPWPTSTLHYR